jgi:hypothetical protein
MSPWLAQNEVFVGNVVPFARCWFGGGNERSRGGVDCRASRGLSHARLPAPRHDFWSVFSFATALHFTPSHPERGIISCYVDVSFSRGQLADFDDAKPFPANESQACGTFVALDEMPLISFYGDRWNATSIAGGWSELLNAKSHQARQFLVLQLAATEGSRVEGTLVMTCSSQAADTVARPFCCWCEKASTQEL